MPRMVIRLRKRRTSWEASDVTTIVQTEFWDKRGGRADLQPSVYVLKAQDASRASIVRVHAEHAVSLLKAPPNGAIDMDLEGASTRSPTPSAGATKFAFANARHQEILLADVRELYALVQTACATRDQREHDISRVEILDHAIGQIDAGDSEWKRALAEEPGSEWAKLVEKQRKAQNAAQKPSG